MLTTLRVHIYSLCLADLLARPGPVLALAPMQAVTDLPFMRLIQTYGGADLYYTEYFRVHDNSRLDKHILSSITENPTGRPVIAQMIGNDIPNLVRIARELQQHPVAGIDLTSAVPRRSCTASAPGAACCASPRVSMLSSARCAMPWTGCRSRSRRAWVSTIPACSTNCCPSSRGIPWTCSPSMAAPWPKPTAARCITISSPAPSRRCPARCWPTATCVPRARPPPC